MMKKGFTLIEMIIVVSIILILSSVAIPVTIGQITKSKERKYLIEAKIIESAVEMYNSEMIDNKIIKAEDLESIRLKLTSGTRKYLSSWPSNLVVLKDNKEIEIQGQELSAYNLNNLFNYIIKKETEFY
ncbi:prepilin-type N-terminal cleavage/methylation domain-containing protein [Clostridium cylindrosporum]|nr:prepilin-type N-terminal cleavage/methylation domain-containing protein [Clostridium cylindrosporum]